MPGDVNEFALHYVDVENDAETQEISIQCAIGVLPNFDPESSFYSLFGYKSCPSSQSYQNSGSSMCSGTAPFTIQSGASASGAAVLYYHDYNYFKSNLGYNYQFATNIQAQVINSGFYPNNTTYTDALGDYWLWGTASPQTCMSHTDINHYWGTSMPYVLDKTKTNMLSLPASYLYIGSSQPTWNVGQLGNLSNASFWIGGQYRFGHVALKSPTLKNPNLIFQ